MIVLSKNNNRTKLDNIVVTYSDANSNIIAVCRRVINRDGNIKFELYYTDNDLSNFEFVKSSINPNDFDKILYGKKSNTASHINTVSVNNKSSKDNKRMVKKLF